MKASYTFSALSALALAGSASAASITGGVTPMTTFTAYNLDAGTSDWVIYGALSGSPTTTDYITERLDSSFSTPISGASTVESLGGAIKFGHGGGFDDEGNPVAATASGDARSPVDEDATLASLSFTHVMLGAEETVKVYVYAKQPQQTTLDVAASIGSDSWSVTDTTNLFAQGGGGNKEGKYGIVTLDVTGAEAGDVLNFTVSTDYSGAGEGSPAGFWGVGLAGASTTVNEPFIVPEPASVALAGLGGLMLLGRRRR